MRVLVVADGRSPIARRWLQGLVSLRHEVILVSSFPCDPLPDTVTTVVMPLAFGGMAGSQVGGKGGVVQRQTRKVVGGTRGGLMRLRYLLGPLSLSLRRGAYQALVRRLAPDVVHALRIPYEGMLASYTPKQFPLIISTWGNDLTLHAWGSAAMQRMTRRTLRRCDGLMTDTRRDHRLGQLWGLSAEKPHVCLPGNGGIDLAEIHKARDGAVPLPLTLPPADVPLIVNPRGFRPGSVHNDVFFRAIPLVLKSIPAAKFWCAGMKDQTQAQQWVSELQLHEDVHLLPFMSQEQLWRIFWNATCSVTISSHDGTPNSLLESMACGCLPVAGDIESLREWVTPGLNGLLVPPEDVERTAEAMIQAVQQPQLRQQAAETNLQIVAQRADIHYVRSQIQVFYQRISDRTGTLISPAA
ncbi:MAG: glycosyltransferase [Anaerolineae bacterium]|nr:glycosyltransferase [Anaerolineae bacterium]